MTVSDEYSCSNTENLPLPIEMQLSEKPKTFSVFYCLFRICIKFWTFWKKNQPHIVIISEVIDSERRAYLNAGKVLFLQVLWQWTFKAPAPQNGQTHQTIRRRILWVCLTILWGWRLKGQKINSEFEMH